MRKKEGFTLVELMVVVGIIGILASLAIPNFMVFISKAKQAEASNNLGTIYKCQLAYFSVANTFAGKDAGDGQNAFELINFTPIAGANRYAYILDNTAIIPAKLDIVFALPAGIPSSQTGFTVIAAGNIDGDAFLDVWIVNDAHDIKNEYPDGSVGNDVGTQ